MTASNSIGQTNRPAQPPTQVSQRRAKPEEATPEVRTHARHASVCRGKQTIVYVTTVRRDDECEPASVLWRAPLLIIRRSLAAVRHD